MILALALSMHWVRRIGLPIRSGKTASSHEEITTGSRSFRVGTFTRSYGVATATNLCTGRSKKMTRSNVEVNIPALRTSLSKKADLMNHA